jgi:hypothetical protein
MQQAQPTSIDRRYGCVGGEEGERSPGDDLDHYLAASRG